MFPNSLLTTASDGVYFLRFLIFSLVIILPIGFLAKKLFQIRLQNNFENVLFCLITGTLFSNSLYFLIRANHFEGSVLLLFGSIFMAALFVAVFYFSKQLPQWKQPTWEVVALLLIMAVLGFYLFHRTWHAIYWTPDGGLVFTQGLYSDPIWKLSIASELEHTVPPQMSIFAGRRLTYHYFMELFTVFVQSGTKIDLITLRFFMVPLYSFTVICLAIFCFFKRVYEKGWLALIALGLIMPVSGLGLIEDAHIPFTIALFLLAITLISDALKKKSALNWLLIMLLFAHSMMYEAIISFNYLAGLAFASLLYFAWNRRIEPAVVVILGGMLALLFQFFAIGRLGGGEGKQFFSLQFPLLVLAVKDFDLLRETLKFVWQTMRHTPLGEWEPRYYGIILSLPFLGLYALIRILFIYFNISLVALPAFWDRIRGFKAQKPILFFFIPVLAFGIIFPFFFSISFLWAASFRMLNYSVFLLIAFTPHAFISFWSRNKLLKIIFACACAFLWLIPAVQWQFYYQKNSALYGKITPEEMQIFNYLRTQTPVDSILLHHFLDHDVLDADKNGEVAWVFKDHYYFGSALGGRRVVLEGSRNGMIKESSKAGQDEVNRITEDIQSIYTTTDSAAAMAILKKYHVSYLWVPSNKPLQFSSREFLEVAIQNPQHTLYRVHLKTA